MNDFILNKGIYTLCDHIAIPKGTIQIILRDAKSGRIKSIDYIKNTFMTLGKNSIADALRGNEDNNKGIITYCAVGTGTTAPDPADTDLETELARKAISARTVDGNDALFQTFFTTSEGNGTLREAGLFGDDASATVNSGTMFCRAAINRTKSSNDTLTLNWTVTIG